MLHHRTTLHHHNRKAGVAPFCTTAPPAPPPIGRCGSGGGAKSSDTLLDLAKRVHHLAPSHRDPEQFLIYKSEIAAELRRLAKDAE